MNEKKFLTRAEHQVMMNLWALEDACGFTLDIMQGYKGKKPAYTTLATFLKILAQKGYVESRKIGSMLYYTATVSKMEYCQEVLEKAKDDYFNGKAEDLIKFVMTLKDPTKEEKAAIASALK